MRCPACESALEIVPNATGQAALCTGCGGVWVDPACFRALEASLLDEAVRAASFAGVELLRKKNEATGTAFRQNARRPESERACVVCQTLLVPMRVTTGQIPVEVCHTHGVWFDAGELWTAMQEVSLDRAVMLAHRRPEPTMQSLLSTSGMDFWRTILKEL